MTEAERNLRVVIFMDINFDYYYYYYFVKYQ